MTKKYILEGIEAYKVEQEEILTAIRDHGGKLTEREFDQSFADIHQEVIPTGETVLRYKFPERIKFFPVTPKTFVLGSLAQPGWWAKYLHLAQLMSLVGLISIHQENGLVVYCIGATGCTSEGKPG